MGLECVYPAHRGRNKRQEKTSSRCVATQRDANVRPQTASDKAESSARESPINPKEKLSLDNLHNITFDNDSCIDESLFDPWMMNTGLDGESASRSSSTDASSFDFAAREVAFSLQSSSATMALPELSTVNTPLTSLSDLSPTDGVGELEPWEEARMAPDSDISWAISADGHSTVGTSPEALPLEPRDKVRPRSSGCRCLLSSISFLERLVSRAASCESRIDRLLGDVREAIETLARFIACERCVAQVELNIVLAMAARQISVICGKVANGYKTMHAMTSAGDKGSSRESQQRPGLEGSANSVIEISVSTYRVNQRERLYLLKSLVTLQIAELQQHINTMAWRYRNRPNPGQAGALREAKNQIKLAQMAISSNS